MSLKNSFIQIATEHQINPIDGGAAGVGILTWLKAIPDLVGLVTLVWFCLRIYIIVRDEILNKKKEKDNGDE
jgi:hypothetical protein